MRSLLALILFTLLVSCSRSNRKPPTNNSPDTLAIFSVSTQKPELPDTIKITRKVLMKGYFNFIDSLISQHPKLNKDSLGEYILVHSNPWILDSLRSFDYYFQKSKKHFLYDLSQQAIFNKGDLIILPTQVMQDSITMKLRTIQIDVNIPEFKLRLLQGKDTIFSCTVRVGRNGEEYYETLKQEMNLRTPIGGGKVVAIHRLPVYYDVHTGDKYETTRRDDGRSTLMPNIPSLEPEISGKRFGTMIHPTTNLKTLGKAYSHGCIGVREADAWTIYYYSPKGTPVKFRYDLQLIRKKGDTIQLKDIYNLHISPKKDQYLLMIFINLSLIIL
jgi:L,D-transpeptidase ErfK/SrfK